MNLSGNLLRFLVDPFANREIREFGGAMSRLFLGEEIKPPFILKILKLTQAIQKNTKNQNQRHAKIENFFKKN